MGYPNPFLDGIPTRTECAGGGAPSGAALINRFLEGFDKKNTRRSYRGDLKGFFGGEASLKEIRQVEARDVRGYLREEAEDLGEQTVRRRATTLSSFYRWLWEEGLVEETPFSETEGPRKLAKQAFADKASANEASAEGAFANDESAFAKQAVEQNGEETPTKETPTKETPTKETSGEDTGQAKTQLPETEDEAPTEMSDTEVRDTEARGVEAKGVEARGAEARGAEARNPVEPERPEERPEQRPEQRPEEGPGAVGEEDRTEKPPEEEPPEEEPPEEPMAEEPMAEELPSEKPPAEEESSVEESSVEESPAPSELPPAGQGRGPEEIAKWFLEGVGPVDAPRPGQGGKAEQFSEELLEVPGWAGRDLQVQILPPIRFTGKRFEDGLDIELRELPSAIAEGLRLLDNREWFPSGAIRHPYYWIVGQESEWMVTVWRAGEERPTTGTEATGTEATGTEATGAEATGAEARPDGLATRLKFDGPLTDAHNERENDSGPPSEKSESEKSESEKSESEKSEEVGRLLWVLWS